MRRNSRHNLGTDDSLLLELMLITRLYFLLPLQMSLASLSLLLVVITGVHSMDEFMSCDRYYEGKRTARMIDQIPCDMTKNTYCQYKGSAYPE